MPEASVSKKSLAELGLVSGKSINKADAIVAALNSAGIFFLESGFRRIDCPLIPQSTLPLL